jgi:hypothetical protein
MQNNKTFKYGLNLPQKKKPALLQQKRPLIFSDEDDDIECATTQQEIKTVNAQINQTTVSKQIQEEYEKVVAEDHTAFLYDEVYDSMKAAEKSKLMLTHNREQEEVKVCLHTCVVFDRQVN